VDGPPPPRARCAPLWTAVSLTAPPPSPPLPPPACPRVPRPSLQPNAYAKIVNIETNNPKILLFAKRVVEDGEELTYDYKFPIDGEGGTACHCGSTSCTGYLGGI